MLNTIIFSRDRACQLDLLLRSWRKFVINSPPPTVIFRATHHDFDRGYRLLAERFPEVKFVIENKFRIDVLAACNSPLPYLMFAMDDQIFRRPVDVGPQLLAPLDDPKIICIALPGHPRLTYSYSLDAKVPQPPLTVWRNSKDTWYVWKWKTSGVCWNYPWSHDTCIFRTADALPYFRSLEWETPNRMEVAMNENARTVFAHRPWEAMRTEASAINIPANRVQNTFPNRMMKNERQTAEELNKRYLAGERIDLEPLTKIEANAVHVEAEYSFYTDNAAADGCTDAAIPS